MKIDIFDTTLRDGFQQEGISPSVKDKIAIAKLIDDLSQIGKIVNRKKVGEKIV